MKSRFALSVLFVLVASTAFAQSDPQKSFDKMKTLAGTWEGRITTVPPQAEVEGKQPSDVIRELLTTVPVLQTT